MGIGYQNTPVDKDDFTRTMTESFDDKDMIGVPQGGQSMFGDPSNGSQTVYSRDKNVVEINIMRGNNRMAALVPRNGVPEGIDLSTTRLVEPKSSNFQRIYPLIQDTYEVHADQLLFQIPNETYEQRITREDRAVYLMAVGAKEVVRRIGRMNEYLAWQSLLTGKQPSLYGVTTASTLYDFLRPAGHTVTVGTAWATGDPIGDISDGVALIRAAAHVTPDYCVLAADSWAAMSVNENIYVLADNRNYQFIRLGLEANIPPKYNRMIANGFMCVGMLLTENGAVIYLFLYVDEYQDLVTGTSTPFVPSGYALLGFTGARCDRYFGPPEMMPMAPSVRGDFQALFGISLDNPPVPPNAKPGSAFDPNMMYFDAFPMGKNNGWVLRGHAAPIYATTMTDAFYQMNGCV